MPDHAALNQLVEEHDPHATEPSNNADPCMGLLKSIADVYACWYFSVLS